MLGIIDSVLYKLRYIFVGMLMLASIIFLPHLIANVQASTASGDELESGLDSEVNIITHSLAATADSIANTTGQIGESVTKTAGTVGSSLASGSAYVGRGIVGGIKFAAATPAKLTDYFIATPLVSAVVQPASPATVPIIDQKEADLYATRVALTQIRLASQTAGTIDAEPVWPIHGQVTTRFGVPHWPFQPTHTGIDISDGQRSGITGIKPFRPGKVIEAAWSNRGLGNHVVIDHGAGITSAYGHMSSLTVQIGQIVDKNTILGYEGSTGASTGTHLHFEVRVNGTPVNPMQYVNGQP